MNKDIKEIVIAFETLQWARLRFKFLVGNKIKSLVESGKYKTIDACCREISKAIEDATGTMTAEGTYRKHYELAGCFTKAQQNVLIKHHASVGYVSDLKRMDEETKDKIIKNISSGKLTDLRPMAKKPRGRNVVHDGGRSAPNALEPIVFEFPINEEVWENRLASLLSRGQPVAVNIAKNVLRRFK